MSNLIPYAIGDYKVYIGNTLLPGTAGEITLPNLEEMLETVEGAGILGEIEVGTPGRFGKFETEFPFQTIDRALTELKKNSDLPIILRAFGSYLNKESGKTEYKQIKISQKGPRTTLDLGKISANKPTQSTVKMAPFYIKVEIDNEVILEIDKLNGIYKLNGEDQLAEINSYL